MSSERVSKVVFYRIVRGKDGFTGLYIWRGVRLFGADGFHLVRYLGNFAWCIRIVRRRTSTIGQRK